MFNIRRTQYVVASSTPFWNETFVYPNLPMGLLMTKFLEITAWSYNRDVANEFLGELVLDLSGERDCVFVIFMIVFINK